MLRLRVSENVPHRNVLGYNVDNRRVVGRASKSDIQLPGMTVSREHCTVESVQGKYVLVRDLGSRNGTSVNGLKIKGEAKAFPGMVIQVGEFGLLVEDADLEEAAGAITPCGVRT